MSHDRKTGREGRSRGEGQGVDAALPRQVQHARYLARVEETRARYGASALARVTPATDAPAPPAREMPKQKENPNEADDAPPLPARERQGGGAPG